MFFSKLAPGSVETSAAAPRTAAVLPQRFFFFCWLMYTHIESSHTKIHTAHRWLSGFCHHIIHQIYKTWTVLSGIVKEHFKLWTFIFHVGINIFKLYLLSWQLLPLSEISYYSILHQTYTTPGISSCLIQCPELLVAGMEKNRTPCKHSSNFPIRENSINLISEHESRIDLLDLM